MERPGMYHIKEKEFEELFCQNFNDLMGFVCSYVRDEEVARDIVHDVFVVVWSNRFHVDASRPLVPYLFTLARNYSLDWIRHRQVELKNEMAIARSLEEIPEDMEEYEISLNRLREKVAQLPDKQREVLLKCFMEGKMYHEIAEELSISQNTVKTHLQRALKFLRDELQNEIILFFISVYCIGYKYIISRS